VSGRKSTSKVMLVIKSPLRAIVTSFRVLKSSGPENACSNSS
jgi:hypothetical protein